jgi:hypothetical protein
MGIVLQVLDQIGLARGGATRLRNDVTGPIFGAGVTARKARPQARHRQGPATGMPAIVVATEGMLSYFGGGVR